MGCRAIFEVSVIAPVAACWPRSYPKCGGKFMQGTRRTLAAVLVSVLAACSPYSYSKEISKISDGVDKLSEAYTAGFTGITADWDAQTHARAIAARAIGQNPRILASSGCLKNIAKEDDPPCALYVKGTPEPKWTDVELKRKKATDALRDLKNYANALAAVTNAADRSAYDAAVAQLASAVGAVLEAANAAMPGSSAAVSAGINIFGWLVGTALDEQRYDTLVKAVNAVGKPLPPATPGAAPSKSFSVCYKPDPATDKQVARSSIRIVTDGLCDGLEALAARQRELLKNQGEALLTGLNNGKWTEGAFATTFSEAQTAFAAQDALRKANPGSAANDLADAHDKLVEAIQDPKQNYAALMKAAGAFADKVSAVEAALKATTPAKKGS